jgi:hypothetical protein
MSVYAKAIEDYTSALAREPENGTYYFKRGAIFLKLDKTAEAKADFERGTRLGNLDAQVALLKM